MNVKGLLAAPPVGVVLDQRMVEKVSPTNDGDKKRESSLERDVFAVSCTVTDDAVTLYGFDITVQSDSPVSRESILCVLILYVACSNRLTVLTVR